MTQPESQDVLRAQRGLELSGEVRANFLRILGIGLFYLVELINYYGLSLPDISPRFHQAVTGLAVTWVFLSLGLWFCFQKHIFNPALKYVATTVDILLITLMLLLADGPRSPLCAVYPLIVVLASLRFSLPLLRFSTLAAVIGYLVICSNAKWYRPQFSVPHYYILIFSISLILTGVILGQVLRRVRNLLAGVIEQGASRDRG